MVSPVNEELTESYLREVLADFEVCARRALERMLRAPTRCPRDFRYLAEAPTIPLTCGIRTGNGLFEAALFLEVDRRDYAGLLPGVKIDGEILDTIGEIANVMAGSFLGQRSFKKHFGPMLPTPPVFSFQGSSLGKASCIQGVIVIGSAKLSAGFMVHSIQRDELI
ncbi:MAG: hypothetical protein ABI036_09790 [Fibrobacteria bacterium]